MTDKDTITLPREVAEHLTKMLEECPLLPNQDWSERDCVALNALRTALAAEQPKPEPVAWQCREHGDDEWFDCSKEAYGINPSRYVYRRLYTAPPDAEALRREET